VRFSLGVYAMRSQPVKWPKWQHEQTVDFAMRSGVKYFDNWQFYLLIQMNIDFEIANARKKSRPIDPSAHLVSYTRDHSKPLWPF